ncbi:MAG TPA: DNA/RNA nuclease SfsA [Deltaproteobacteria bacterium]|nr:DNA/RNA nuclease SfsA [Deltaproteobacteria bacterium]
MQFGQTLQAGKLVSRYKRFLADVRMDDGRMLTVHCPNSGSMSGCREPGSPVLISLADNPKRKYVHTLEMVRVDTTWVGVNTSRTNGLVAEAIGGGVVAELAGIETIRPEIKVSAESRLDFLLTRGDERIYVEVKNCSLAKDRAAMFPDAVTARGAKHLAELLALRQTGYRAVVFFCVQREDVDYFAPAAHIDPGYALALREVASHGVEVLAYGATLSPEAITVVRPLPVQLDL